MRTKRNCRHPGAVTTTPTTYSPTTTRDRALAPDLARGAMLLLIALANAPWYLWASDSRLLSQHPVDGSPLDQAVQSVMLIAVDSRTYPMFAFLFGYGIWQLYSRQLAAGTDRLEARRLLRRRHLWMLVFGAVHALLLWMGDIIGAYGLAGLVLVALFLDRRDVTIKIWAGVLVGLLGLGAIGGALGALVINLLPASVTAQFTTTQVDLGFTAAEPNYLLSMVWRIGAWLIVTPTQGLVMLAVPAAILIAILAARHRVLEEPERFLPLLRRTAVVGILIGWSCGLVSALQNLDLLGLSRASDFMFPAVQTFAGLACGIGYVALFGLVAERMSRRGRVGPVASAIRAVGARSLTCYLAQSVVFAPLMSAWGFGLGAELSSWSIALVAIATWLATVVLAVLLERAGRRGPAETLLRRLAYPRRARVPEPAR